MKLTIIIPAFNESSTISEILEKVYKTDTGSFEKEIIVINDGSTDNTKGILETLKSKYQFTLVNNENNMGKGSAVISALAHAQGDYVLIQDADLEYNPDDYIKLLSAIKPNTAVYGTRNAGNTERGYLAYYIGGRMITSLFNFLFKQKLSDLNTCYKLFALKDLQNMHLESKKFQICEEMSCKAAKAGIAIVEVPISYKPRSFNKGKKIRPKDGFAGVFAIFKYWFQK